MVTVQVGGVDFKMLIDSGANSNIIDEGTWEQLKAVSYTHLTLPTSDLV